MTRDESTEISIREIDQALKQGVATADPDRTAGLAGFLRLGEAREAGLRRELERLSKVLLPGDPRLEGLVLRLEANQAMREEAAFEVERSETGLPAPDKQSWTLYGFVRGAEPGSLDDKSLALYDAGGTRIPETETPLEKDGRFLLRYKAPGAGPAREKEAVPEVFAYVTDARHRVLYRDPRGMRPENGHITYLEINFGKAAPPPSGATRPKEPPDTEKPAPESPPRRRAASTADQPSTRRRTSRSPRRTDEGAQGEEQPR